MWLERLNVGDVIDLDGHGQGKVRALWCGELEIAPEELIAKEHDPDCRMIGGLLDALRDIYGDVDGQSVVTCIVFEVNCQ